MYRAVFTHLIRHVDPEIAHGAALKGLELAGATPIGRRLLAACCPRPHRPASSPRLGIFPRRIPGILGLAAGMDKNATAVLALSALGFGFVEIGTVTRHPQPGNDKPRMWRHYEVDGLRNRMGFNNDGADVVAGRLRQLRSTRDGRRCVVGVNIGKSKITDAAEAPADYAYSARALSPWADYLVINVSSPNTPGLRDLQAISSLQPITMAVQEAAVAVGRADLPILVKIAPDLADDDVCAVAHMIRAQGLAGMVAVNTTIAHNYGAGGLSGRPVHERACQVVELARQELGEEPLLIGVGGIFTPADGRRLLAAGADLLQAYSGFVYEGGLWPARMNRALAQ